MWIPLALALALSSCRPPKAPPAPPDPVKLPQARLTVESRAGATALDVEVARDDPSRERGLMFRPAMPAGVGMLFIFRTSEPHVFWMKNTLVPLDMLFLDDHGRIVGIIENAEPLTLTPRDPHAPSRYVLEVAGGTAFAHGWRAGDKVDLPALPEAR